MLMITIVCFFYYKLKFLCIITIHFYQTIEYEEMVWSTAATLILPEHCISQAKLLNFQSIGALELLRICFRRVLWKFYDLVGSDDFYNLSADELYWLLKNPLVVDPSGGVFALEAIEFWVNRHCQLKTKSTGDPTENLQLFSEKLRARFVFALMESMETRVAADAPLNYKSLCNFTNPIINERSTVASDKINLNFAAPLNRGCKISRDDERSNSFNSASSNNNMTYTTPKNPVEMNSNEAVDVLSDTSMHSQVSERVATKEASAISGVTSLAAEDVVMATVGSNTPVLPPAGILPREPPDTLMQVTPNAAAAQECQDWDAHKSFDCDDLIKLLQVIHKSIAKFIFWFLIF